MRTNLLPVDDDGNVIIPAPEHVRRGQKERCTYCGRIYNSRRPYFKHFEDDHLNDDGTWREAPHRQGIKTDRERDTKPWWVMHNDKSDPNYHLRP